jgi:hypothetical protein
MALPSIIPLKEVRVLSCHIPIFRHVLPSRRHHRAVPW